MAKLSIFEEGKVQEILITVGRFGNGEQRFARAPIALLTLPKTTSNPDITTYVMTNGTGAQGTDSDVFDSDDRVLVQSRNTMGYFVPPFVLDGNTGDHVGEPDTWKGVHEFHYV